VPSYVVGGRGTCAGGGIIGIDRFKRGEDERNAMEMVFFLSIVQAHTQEFAAKKTKGKNHVMQWHEQVLPPCRCIAQIQAGE
jgi:hypothetical protein